MVNLLLLLAAWTSMLTAAGEAASVRRFAAAVVDSSELGTTKVAVQHGPEGLEVVARIEGAASSHTDIEVRARCQVGARILADVAHAWQEGSQPEGTRTAQLFASPYGGGTGPLSEELKQASRCELEFRATSDRAFGLACWSGGRTKLGPCPRRLIPPRAGTTRGAFVDISIDTVPIAAGKSFAVRAQYGVWKARPWGALSRYESRISCLVEGRWLTQTHAFQRLEGSFFEQEAGETWVGEDRFFRLGHLKRPPELCNLELTVQANDGGQRAVVLERESCSEKRRTTAQACAGHPKPSGPGSPVDHKTVSVPAVFVNLAYSPGFSGMTDPQTRQAIEANTAPSPTRTAPFLEVILTLERPVAGTPATLRGEIDCDFGGTSNRESVDFLFEWTSYALLRPGESQLVQRAVFYKDPQPATPERCEVELWLGEESKSDPANIALGRWCRTTSADPLAPC